MNEAPSSLGSIKEDIHNILSGKTDSDDATKKGVDLIAIAKELARRNMKKKQAQ
jgi:hypothetical protein